MNTNTRQIETLRAGPGLPAQIAPYLQQIPDSDGSRYFRRAAVRIGIIADVFFYQAIEAAAQFVRVMPDRYPEQIGTLDVLLVVSAWSGEKEEWRGISTEGKPKRLLAYEVIDACKARGIPTVFYSKEDPVHYERYLGLARRCDTVFTSCVEKIADYVQDCGHTRIYPLRFSINPTYHNPIGSHMFEKQRTVLFAGSWMSKYPARCEALAMLLEGVLKAGCRPLIIDRMYGAKGDKHRFPDAYAAYLSPSMDHAQLQKAHKLFDWALNINTITDSATMFANRVYELQACGNLLLSNYSVGVNARAPAVFTALDAREVTQILRTYTPQEVYARQMMALRSVMTGDTCYERIEEVLAPLGIHASVPVRHVAVVSDAVDGAVRAAFERQTYPHKALLTRDALTDRALMDYDIVAPMDPGMDYGAFYLEDMVNGFKYTDADYVTKDAYLRSGVLVPGQEHMYVSRISDPHRTAFWAQAFTTEQLLAMRPQMPAAGGYSIDPFEYDAAPVAPAVRVASAEVTDRQTPYALSVIIPIYNNGKALYGKAFASLRRSSLFSDMEILLIDDGSTDGQTPQIVLLLAAQYPNVRTYCFEPGGSGSASRPRNRGAEMATADYITYLDPDNEAIGDGYARLYTLCRDEGFDLAIGNLMVCKETPVRSYYYTRIKTSLQTDVVEVSMDKHQFLEAIGFMPMSNQATVLRRSIVADNALLHVVGALGQDTLFSYQVMLHAGRIKAVPTPVVVYYAAIEGTSVNNITEKFFEKYYKVHAAQAEWLRSEGLLEAYVQKRFAYYYRNWMLKKLTLYDTGRGRVEDCARIVWEIFQCYREGYVGDDAIIEGFAIRCEAQDYKGAFGWLQEAFLREEDAPQ